MTPENMRKQIDRIEAKYGPIEFFFHGPGHEGILKSGFGPESNWYIGEVTLGDGTKVLACFVHGLPIAFEGELQPRFPVLTGTFPLKIHRITGKEDTLGPS